MKDLNCNVMTAGHRYCYEIVFIIFKGPLHRALRRHYSAFIRDMEPLDVAERLIQEDVITAEQLVDIQETQLTSDKRRYLLRILLQKTEQDLVVFKNALSDSLQAHLANLLV